MGVFAAIGVLRADTHLRKHSDGTVVGGSEATLTGTLQTEAAGALSASVAISALGALAVDGDGARLTTLYRSVDITDDHGYTWKYPAAFVNVLAPPSALAVQCAEDTLALTSELGASLSFTRTDTAPTPPALAPVALPANATFECLGGDWSATSFSAPDDDTSLELTEMTYSFRDGHFGVSDPTEFSGTIFGIEVAGIMGGDSSGYYDALGDTITMVAISGEGGFSATTADGTVVEDIASSPLVSGSGQPHTVTCDGDEATLTSPLGGVTTLQRATATEAPAPSAVPTTAPPTTAAPTTAPTPAAPTTAAPTTVAPTTAPRSRRRSRTPTTRSSTTTSPCPSSAPSPWPDRDAVATAPSVTRSPTDSGVVGSPASTVPRSASRRASSST